MVEFFSLYVYVQYFNLKLSLFFMLADVDECDINNFQCSHDCVNTVGSAYCVCPHGFELAEDNKTCTGRISIGQLFFALRFYAEC